MRPGPGSLRVLCWIARLGAVGTEPLQHALGLSRSTVYSHLGRLRDAGLLLPVATTDGLGGVVAVTARGAQLARGHGIPTVQPRLSAAAPGLHHRAVSWIAACCSRFDIPWAGPAQLQAEPGWRLVRDDGHGHLPDLGFRTTPEDRCAIEVELHPKTPDRLQSILRGYQHHLQTGQLQRVVYVCDKPAVAVLINRHAPALLGDALRVDTLHTWIAHTRTPHPRNQP